MGRRILSVLLASILWVYSGSSVRAETAAAIATSQAGASKKPTLKEQVIQIPAGAQVEVRLHSKERFRGRLVEVGDEGFTLQIAHEGRIETRKISFGDVRSVKQIHRQNTAKYIFFGVAMTVGLLLAVGFIIDAARSGD
jgi:hypothetical protein